MSGGIHWHKEKLEWGLGWGSSGGIHALFEADLLARSMACVVALCEPCHEHQEPTTTCL